ncbi:hypothetical protein [Clostridium butyricum]|jgi:DNA-directed RNA polymerase specialized sigma24 family protein|uniref:RNA polymerase subunit sigma-70 n=1 Tax=Clostridium butyricum TaxID=1492 RepID=A0AAP9RFM6_CLOBU|nr:hypothetical protein [Clostridium butyricum]ALP91194.1 RNA polymerase subunit sigma-70 [Clostridium butyricum]ANF14817.1 RNA polymerase subunit sigma-70 [Clostridium butyricum]ENZ33483.1 hypothetical protein HMPREF1084_01952 [Clostridium butyricum 60E.3]MBZ5746945.1 RNA polymerase subunit sigma-70 [Clostridium butyricum]MCI3009046.1 RNA polymerase subunit sigma-70 [Clostridium butyricum]
MAEMKNIFNLYRENKCKIENLKIEIENLRLNGVKENDVSIQMLILNINKLENENKRIDNKLKLLPENEYKVVKLVFIDGIDKKRVSKTIDRSIRQVDRILNKAAKKIII